MAHAPGCDGDLRRAAVASRACPRSNICRASWTSSRSAACRFACAPATGRARSPSPGCRRRRASTASSTGAVACCRSLPRASCCRRCSAASSTSRRATCCRSRCSKGGGPSAQVPVVALVDDSVGLQAYMRIDALRAMLREGGVITGAAVTLDPAATGRFYAAVKALPAIAGVALTRRHAPELPRHDGGEHEPADLSQRDVRRRHRVRRRLQLRARLAVRARARAGEPARAGLHARARSR